MTDTIFALSSGSPPAAIGLIRISGPAAGDALRALAGVLPEPRRVRIATLRDARGEILDRALVLWLPGPGTATGEDSAELHCHGGRAVIAAAERALAEQDGLRRAEPGEFTRRAFLNGRIGLAEAEGLADLLSAETELQRAAALAISSGTLSRIAEAWRERLLMLSARVESVLDFADDDDVGELGADFAVQLEKLASEMGVWLARPRAEALKDGIRVVIAGPPNAGKSTLFNALIEQEAAITSPIAGTTRDVLTRSVAIGGVPFNFIDTAGLRHEAGDVIEAIGVERAGAEIERADIVLWLGPEGEGPRGAWEIDAQCDRPNRAVKHAADHVLSAKSGEGLPSLKSALLSEARTLLPKPGEGALSSRQHGLVLRAREALASMGPLVDPLLLGEHLRSARAAFDMLLGRTATEDMLDTLFGRFCIGK